MSGLSAPNGTDIDFAKFEDRFSSWTCVHSYLTCVRVRKECSVGKTLSIRMFADHCSLFLDENVKKGPGSTGLFHCLVLCFLSFFSLVSLLSPVYFILYNLVYIEFSILLFLLFFFFYFFIFLYDFSHALCLLYPSSWFLCSVCMFFFFSSHLYFSILGVHLWFASFASLRTVNTMVIPLSSQKKIKIKCSRIQEYGIFTCTKISAITVVSPHTYPIKETINLVFSQFVFSVFSM